MNEQQKDTINYKIAWILGESENRIGWDMSLHDQIYKLVQAYEKLADEIGVTLYER